MSDQDPAATKLCFGRAAHPMMHAQALRLHCGGPIGLRQALGLAQADEHAMVGVAHERHGSLTELPWDLIVQAITSWQPYRRRKPVEP